MNRFVKISLIIFLSILAVFLSLVITFFAVTRNATLDINKLSNVTGKISVYDADGNEVTSAALSENRSGIKLSELNDDTINAFIASEDRTFYKHSGLNYKRMLKAAYKNLMSRSFKEGASTISQQLIKNTHLSNEKTISRKLNEIRLTMELEKRFDKDRILEMYLNSIYFGHNCYGIESAAEFYFNKNAKDLSLTESATLAGLLSSPNNFSPYKNYEKSLKRRNIVLDSMKECGFISDEECIKAKSEPIETMSKKANFSDYIGAVFDELENNGIDFYSLADGCKIYTNLNAEMQKFIENTEYPCDNSIIITQNGGKVAAYKSTIGNAKRQPGSTIKPIGIYAPAINEKLIEPYTRILDEKIDFNGYSPQNADKKYHGYVSIADSIKMSYNVPAVKTLNGLTVEKAEQYLSKMNITLSGGEKNLALALGGMEQGLTLKQIADGYSTFANSGEFANSVFIDRIESANGEIIYKSNVTKQKIFEEGTASLINEILIDTARTGTAKKLNDLGFEIAAKTGTCGDTEGNTDAYSVCYTPEHTIAVWLGDKDNNKLKITSGTDCCNACKSIIKYLYKNTAPEKLDITSGTINVNLDAEDYFNENKITLCDPLSPQINVLTVKTLSDDIPKAKSLKFTHPTIFTPDLLVENESVKIQLCQTKYYSYVINRVKNNKINTIYDGKWKEVISDCPDEGTYQYTVTPYYLCGNNRYYGDEIILPKIYIGKKNSSPQVKIPKIVDDEWYNI